MNFGGKLRHFRDSRIVLLYLRLLGKCEIIIIVKHIVDELADVHCLIGWQLTLKPFLDVIFIKMFTSDFEVIIS